MKIFIVFTGLFIINICVISFNGDLGKLMYMKRALDEIAYECVELASVDTDEALEFGEGLLAHIAGSLNGVKVTGYSCDIISDGDYLYVRVEMNVEGLFKFPFMTGIRIIAERRHELIS